MTLAEKVKSVEEIFQRLEAEINDLKEWSGLHCATGCGKCCFKPDIEATVLEFLPLAYNLYCKNEALALYEKLEADDSTICTIINEQGQKGLCSQYQHRGLICRLFGYSARLNKLSKAEIVTCKIIKSEQAAAYNHAIVMIGVGTKTIPVAGQYYMQLVSIDDELGRRVYPINIAVKKALEIVLQYYSYREMET